MNMTEIDHISDISLDIDQDDHSKNDRKWVITIKLYKRRRKNKFIFLQ